MIDDDLPSPAASLWTATCRYHDSYEPLSGDLDADVTIIGAGYTGLSCALHLAERGYTPIVLEARQPGWGASGRNGGQVIPGLKEDPDRIEADFGPERGPRIVALCGTAPVRIFDICRRYDIDCDMRDGGWIQPAHSRAALARQRRRLRQWRRRDADVIELSAAETAERVGSDIYLGGLFDGRGGSVQPLNYALGLARAAKSMGARIFAETPMLSHEKTGNNYSLRTPAGRVRTRALVMCTNGYTDAAAGPLARTYAPVFSLQVATAPLSPNVRAAILPGGQAASDTRRLLRYFRLDQDGRFVMGGRGSFRETARPRDQAALRRTALKMFPQLDLAEWQYAWGGLVAMTEDHYPHLYEVAPGFLAALGYNGRGVAMATVIGAVLADRIAGTDTRDLAYPVMPLRSMRFSRLRKPGVAVLMQWHRLLDRFGL